MNNIRKFYLAAKNAQRAYSKNEKTSYLSFYQYLEIELNKLGFHGSLSFPEFVNYFKKLPAKRRQSIMRVGRAALKRNTFVSLGLLNNKDRLRWVGGAFKLTKPETDLRKIPFEEDIFRERERKECEKYVKLLKLMISDEEIIKMVLDGPVK